MAKGKTKKPAAKKTAAKPVKKPVKKAAVKKTAKKVAAKPAKKPVAKKAAPKKTAAVKPTATKTVAIKSPKKIDLNNFITPLDDRVIVQLGTSTERMTPGGLYIPDTVTDTSGNLQGFVLSVGRGRRDKKGRVHPMDLRVGDKVIFSEYSGSKIKIQEQDLLILREGDVLGVVG